MSSMIDKIESAGYVMPSNPVDRQSIKAAINEAADSLMRVDAERDLQKDIRNRMKEEFGVPTTLFNQLAKAVHKNNIHEQEAKTEALTENYSLLFGSEE